MDKASSRDDSLKQKELQRLFNTWIPVRPKTLCWVPLTHHHDTKSKFHLIRREGLNTENVGRGTKFDSILVTNYCCPLFAHRRLGGLEDNLTVLLSSSHV